MRKLVYLALTLVFVLCVSGPKTVQSETVKSGIALTYDNDKLKDGAGAQLQRVYGIYALSRYFHVPYVHTPLKEVGYQGLAALEKNAVSSHMTDRWNRVFTIPSDLKLPEDVISWYLEAPKVGDIERLKNEAEKRTNFTC